MKQSTQIFSEGECSTLSPILFSCMLKVTNKPPNWSARHDQSQLNSNEDRKSVLIEVLPEVVVRSCSVKKVFSNIS